MAIVVCVCLQVVNACCTMCNARHIVCCLNMLLFRARGENVTLLCTASPKCLCLCACVCMYVCTCVCVLCLQDLSSLRQEVQRLRQENRLLESRAHELEKSLHTFTTRTAVQEQEIKDKEEVSMDR